MFYSVELLSLRRNGKFAKCWLASHLTRQAFCAKLRRQTISSIDVVETCEELMDYAVSRRSDRKMSLYLSGHLMRGVARILSYQTDILLRHELELIVLTSRSRIIELEKRLGEKKETELLADPIDLLQVPPLVPRRAVRSSHMVEREDDVTIQEADVDREQEIVMQTEDLLNFGALTDTEVEQMLPAFAADGLFLDSVELADVKHAPEGGRDSLEPRVFRVPIVEAIPEHGAERRDNLSNIPLPDFVQDFIPSTGLQTLDGNLPRTPSKHKLSPRVDKETPRTKMRRCLGIEYVEPEMPVPILAQTSIALPAQRQPEPDKDASAISSAEIPLVSLGSSVLAAPLLKEKRFRKTRDEKTCVPTTVMKTRRLDLLYQTRPFQRANPGAALNYSDRLFATPATRLPWGRTLLANYQTMTRKLIVNKKTLPMDERVLEFPKASSVLRSPDISHNPMHEPIIPAEESTDIYQTKRPVQTMVEEQPTHLGLKSLTDGQKGSASTLMLPDPAVSEIRETAEQSSGASEDWLKSVRVQTDVIEAVAVAGSQVNSERSSSVCSRARWSASRVLGLLELLWPQNNVVEFRDICPPSDNTKADASNVFAILLKLHGATKLILQQAEPFGVIYVEKYI